MVVCICNAITESMIKKDPTLIKQVGKCCGKCLKDDKK